MSCNDIIRWRWYPGLEGAKCSDCGADLEDAPYTSMLSENLCLDCTVAFMNVVRDDENKIAALKAEVAEYQTHAEQVTADNEQLRVMLGDAEAEVAELKRLAEGMYSCRCGCIGCVNREAWRKYKEQDNG